MGASFSGKESTMKTILIFSVVLVLGLLVCQEASGQQSAASQEDWDLLLADNGKAAPDREPPGLPPRWDGQERVAGQWQQHGEDPGRKPGMRRGPGPAMGYDRESVRTDPKELLEFIKKYEPELAEKLEKLRQEEPQQLRRKIVALGRLYGPVMQQMEHSPEMGKLSLQKIRLRLKIEATVNNLKEAEQETEKATIKEQLRQHIEELFDIILAQEELRLKHWRERMAELAIEGAQVKAPDKAEEAKGSQKPGTVQSSDAQQTPDSEKAPRSRKGKKPHKPGPPQQQGFENREALIKQWREQKEQIINERLKELLEDIKPFPWQ
jgi:predicted DNA-binding protein